MVSGLLFVSNSTTHFAVSITALIAGSKNLPSLDNSHKHLSK